MKRIILAAAFALAACGQPQQQKQDEAFPAASAPNYDASIGPNGAAGINTALPMTVDAVRAAAPNYLVGEVLDQVDGQAFTAITLSAGDEEVFRLYPSADGAAVHAISTKSPQARGPTTDIVGVTLFAVAPAEEVAFCVSEYLEGATGFACSTAVDGNFWRIYRVPEGYDGPSEPFDAIDPDVLHDSTLVEMRWIAPRAG
ncbi:MAG: hypothetical protein AB7O98_04585 [Hyphomonadaceae bacterium]